LVENHDFCIVLLTIPLDEVSPETSQSVFVGNHNSSDIAWTDSLQNGSKSWSFEIKTTGDISDEYGLRVDFE
jgi:hypothetical protein